MDQPASSRERGWKLQWVTLDLGRQAAILRRDVITGVVHFDGFIIFAEDFDFGEVKLLALFILPCSLMPATSRLGRI